MPSEVTALIPTRATGPSTTNAARPPACPDALSPSRHAFVQGSGLAVFVRGRFRLGSGGGTPFDNVGGGDWDVSEREGGGEGRKRAVAGGNGIPTSIDGEGVLRSLQKMILGRGNGGTLRRARAASVCQSI